MKECKFTGLRLFHYGYLYLVRMAGKKIFSRQCIKSIMWGTDTLTDSFFRKQKGSKRMNLGPRSDDYFWCLNLLLHLSGHFGWRKLRVVETTLTPRLPACKREVALNNTFLVHTAVRAPNGRQPQESCTMSCT